MTAEPSVGSGAWWCVVEENCSLAFPFPLSIVEVDADGSRKSFPACANSSSVNWGISNPPCWGVVVERNVPALLSRN